jgi:hypothetical protein
VARELKCVSFVLVIIAALLVVSSRTQAQGQQQPFIFTAYGGLFFPSYVEFERIYQSSSDLMWGVGVCLPFAENTYATGDIGWFKAEGFFDADHDSAAVLRSKFLHAGILHKQSLGRLFFVRFSGGLSFGSTSQSRSGSHSEEQTVDAEKRLGYFFGVGAERLLDSGRLSFFADAVYDYRRSRSRELFGDFGGLRLVVGAHVYLF